ncbi:alpha/beta fold hydrolase [Pyxidicoccus parkwayensis]|uniref:Alpha/beta fold hydrolase n=2 Tax=Pyxidicoccus parkwayensis TaxID=2813578 RepID=A0ABX7PCS5_9BACT|nr:alpha/beta fold hydrolase [Pyxidicoccus parkwaysis]
MGVAALAAALGGVVLKFGWLDRRSEAPGPFPYDGAPLASGSEARLTAGGWTLSDVNGPPRQRALTRAPAPGQTRWLVFFGGNGPGYLEEARSVLEALDAGRGFGLAAVAPPGFDGSPGRPSPQSLRAGAEAAVRWLVATHRPEELQLVGFSMGSNAALAAAHALAKDGRPARGVVLLAPFTLMDVTDKGLCGLLRTPDRYDNLSLVSEGLPPVRVLHGLADAALPPAHGEELARRLGAPFHSFQGVGHAELLKHPAALAEASKSFSQSGVTE